MPPAPFVVGVDLDGVCADHTEAFRRVVAAERQVSPESLSEERSWGYAEWGIDDEEFERLHRIGVVSYRMLRHMPVVEGAAEALWRLSDAGMWIRSITHRLYTNWGHAAAAGDTAYWLDEVRIPYRDLCFVGGKSAVDADVYVEDSPHNVDALRIQGKYVIVFDQPYNRSIEGPRAHSWEEAEEQITNLAAARADGIQAQFPGIDAGADRLERRLWGG